jgi:hypothetical protein
MNTVRPTSRAWLLFRTFAAFPCFLIVTFIFWELAVGAGVSSGWASGNGWPILAWCFRILGIAIAALTAIATVIVFVAWVVHMVRVIRTR